MRTSFSPNVQRTPRVALPESPPSFALQRALDPRSLEGWRTKLEYEMKGWARFNNRRQVVRGSLHFGHLKLIEPAILHLLLGYVLADGFGIASNRINEETSGPNPLPSVISLSLFKKCLAT